jgi:hypothetical protein
LIPARIALFTKELRAHIVVYAVNLVPELRKMADDLAAN